jgi:hypothetical protein
MDDCEWDSTKQRREAMIVVRLAICFKYSFPNGSYSDAKIPRHAGDKQVFKNSN